MRGLRPRSGPTDSSIPLGISIRCVAIASADKWNLRLKEIASNSTNAIAPCVEDKAVLRPTLLRSS